MKNPLGNMANIMKQAQQMQAPGGSCDQNGDRLGRRGHGYSDRERRAGGCQRPYRS
jgi:5-formyltetrahydrofolate cyclo-ligase